MDIFTEFSPRSYPEQILFNKTEQYVRNVEEYVGESILKTNTIKVSSSCMISSYSAYSVHKFVAE